MPHPSEQSPFEPDPNRDPLGVESLIGQTAFMSRIDGVIGFCEEWSAMLPPGVSISRREDGSTEVTLNPGKQQDQALSTRVMLYKNESPKDPQVYPVLAATILAPTPVEDISHKRGLYFTQDGRAIWQINPVRRQKDGLGFMAEIELAALKQREANQGDITHVSRYLDDVIEKCGLPVAERFL